MMLGRKLTTGKHDHIPRYQWMLTREETLPSMYIRSGVSARTGVDVYVYAVLGA